MTKFLAVQCCMLKGKNQNPTSNPRSVDIYLGSNTYLPSKIDILLHIEYPNLSLKTFSTKAYNIQQNI